MHAQKDGARIGGGAESCTSWRHMANVNTTWLVELSWREFRGSELQKSDACTISQITSFAQISYTESAASNTLTAFQWFQKPLPYINHQNRSRDGDVLYSQASPSHDATLRVAHFSTLIWQAPLLFPDYEESRTATPILLTSCHSSFRAERHPVWTLSRWISDGIWERFLLPPWRWPIQLPASVQDMEPADLLQLLLHGSGQYIYRRKCKENAENLHKGQIEQPLVAPLQRKPLASIVPNKKVPMSVLHSVIQKVDFRLPDHFDFSHGEGCTVSRSAKRSRESEAKKSKKRLRRLWLTYGYQPWANSNGEKRIHRADKNEHCRTHCWWGSEHRAWQDSHARFWHSQNRWTIIINVEEKGKQTENKGTRQ